MKFSVISSNAVDARAQARGKVGPGRDLHISCVFFVPGRPDVREWVFSTVLQ